MGRVYLAVQPEIGARVAVKVLTEQRPDLLERFFAEARAVNLVRHENIAQVIDLLEVDGRAFIVMEHVDGRTLSAATRDGKAPIGGVLTVVGEVLAALEAAHAIGIVHRDIKPDNVLVTHEGHAKVLDFGIAKLGANSLTPRTATGAMMGTPAYMAPEQFGGNVDARADLYSVGVLLFEALTGKLPFEARDVFSLMHAHMEIVPPLIRSVRAEVPASVEAVVARALAKDPAQRYQSAAEMRTALMTASRDVGLGQWAALKREGFEKTMPSTADATLPVVRSRTPWWIAGGIVVVGGVGAVAAFTTHGGAPRVDAKHFDASAFLPEATRLARAKLPDAELVRFDIQNVREDGTADLTLPADGDSSYLFRSPAKSVRPSDLPTNIDAEIACYVEVTVSASGVETTVRSYAPIDGNCVTPTQSPPKCTLAQVWKQAGEKRPNVVAKIALLPDGWFFDSGDAGSVKSFPDRCP